MEQKPTLKEWMVQAPTPVVVPVSIAFGEEQPYRKRHDALCFAVYQLLRCTGLLLLSEVLTTDRPRDLGENARRAVARVLSQIRCPFFSDWITLLGTMTRHREALGFRFFDPSQMELLRRVKQWKVSPAGFEKTIGEQPVLEAFRMLRNIIAHGGVRSKQLCLRDLEVFLPLLRALVEGPFSFLADCEMLALQGDYDDEINRVWLMNGPKFREEEMDLGDPAQKALSAAFDETPILFRSRRHGGILNVYPWFLYREEEQIPKGMIDGFFMRREKNLLYYLDQDRRVLYEPGAAAHPGLFWKGAHARLGELLAGWKLSWEFDKDTMSPWKLRDPIAYHTGILIEDFLAGKKHIPETYLTVLGSGIL